MKVAVATFIYPAPSIHDFARDCLESLARQTYCDFGLFIFNDGLKNLESIVAACGVRAEIIALQGSPADIRRQAIRYLQKRGFDIIVFADIDDILADNRIATALEILKAGADIALNDLVLFGENMTKERVFAGRLEENACVQLKDIHDGNCFGMSNTALRIAAIPDSAFSPRDVEAFDWFLYTCLLANGAISRFTGKTVTFYRQHPDNIAAIYNLSVGNIVRGLNIKRRHFEVFDPTYAAELSRTDSKIKQNPGFQQIYCQAVRGAMRPQPFWWEAIKTYKEFGL